MDKYLFYRPTYRLLADLKTHDLDLSLGTVTDALQQLLPLFEPVYEALANHSRRQPLWHGDETRWQVFATVEGKVGFRWYLWVFHAAEVVAFVLAQGRAHDVPEDYLGPKPAEILVVDRYKAYQAIDQVKRGLIVLAFCWAHVRRDFVTLAHTWPDQEAWAWVGSSASARLYRLNDARGRRGIRGTRGGRASGPGVAPGAAQGAGQSGSNSRWARHWTGLTVFVEHPEVPMTTTRPSGRSVGRWWGGVVKMGETAATGRVRCERGVWRQCCSRCCRRCACGS